jgi:sialate O-acetylesterase
MVLQQGRPVPFWGQADPGEKVTVSLGRVSRAAAAGADGRWRVDLPVQNAGGPHTVTVKAGNTLTLSDVMVGEVWVGSGQSNMQWTVRRSNGSGAEIAAAHWPGIRLFTVKRTVSGEPLPDVEGAWAVCTPETIPDFSAVAYFFGRDLHRNLGVAVGLIHTSWGGTPVEAWTSAPALASTGDLFRERADDWARAIAGYAEAKAKHDAEVAAWQADADKARADGQPQPRRPAPPWGPEHPHRPSGLYNAMVHPLVPFAIQGVIWYQGESNAGRAEQYRTLFPLMIADWRKAWGQGDFPFYWVQLANFQKTKDQPEGSTWAELREAQSMALSQPNTGQAVIIDIGEAEDIHPRNKQDVGSRLARVALAKTYQRPGVVYSGPAYRSHTVEGGKVRISFDHTAPGLVSPGGELKGFAVAGADTHFVWAKAEISGSEVLVGNDDVPQPLHVRYAWADNPVCNLYNGAGLPASPFRTDRLPGLTDGKR